MDTSPASGTLKFGDFELDLGAQELRRNGTPVRLQPQPFKVLVLLASHAGRAVTREDIRRHLWGDDTFVDFDQGMNFCVKQIREALKDTADRPVYIETLPRRGYRFRVPVAVMTLEQAAAPAAPSRPPGASTTMRLQKILWTNIAELRMAEARRQRTTVVGMGLAVVVVAIIVIVLTLR